MTEEFLHFIWQYRLYDNLTVSSSGETITVLDPGRHNTDSGPDFFNARIRIGNTLWAGNVEIHIRSSDWNRHKHYQDAAYDNVILHVVFSDDIVIRRRNGQVIQAVELKEKFDPLLFEKYQYLSGNKAWIPCNNLLYQADNIVVSSWLETLFVMRMENKVNEIVNMLDRFGNDWDKTMLVLVARCFGLKSNLIPFEMLAGSFPYTVLSKVRSDAGIMEALLFGQAGMLDEPRDEYQAGLSKNYRFLQTKYNLEPLKPGTWKFMRLRPGQFPTVRIAELAALMQKTERFFSAVAEAEDTSRLYDLFTAEASVYWETHYIFGKKSPPLSKAISDDMKLLILINAVIPVLFAFGRIRREQSYMNKAVDFAYNLPPEKNSILEKFLHAGIRADNAAHSQALLELKKSYCETKNCLNCRIGFRIIRNSHRVL